MGLGALLSYFLVIKFLEGHKIKKINKLTYSSVLESSCCIALPKLEAITVGDSPRDEV